MVIANTIQLRIGWTNDTGNDMVNVLHSRNDTPVTVDQAFADDVADIVSAAFTSSDLETWYSNHITLSEIGVRDLNVDNEPEFVSAIGKTADAPSDPLPFGVAMVVTLRTAKAGRSFRGRVYLGGWGEGANDTDGRIAALPSAAGVSFIASIDNGLRLHDGGLQLAVASRVLGESNTVQSILSRNSNWERQARRGR